MMLRVQITQTMQQLKKIFVVLGMLSLNTLGTLALAEPQFPEKPITIIVPFAAGGATDLVARALADSMSQVVGQGVIVQNKSGAGGTAGTSVVARAKPDGYTLLLMHTGFTTAPSLYRDALSYDVIKDFEPIGLVVNVPMVIVANQDIPANTFRDFRSYLVANRSKITLAHAGVGSASHLCETLLMKAIKLDLPAIPYNSTASAMTALLGKQVDFMCDQTTNSLPFIANNSVKTFAVTTAKRIRQLPNVPTLNEQGLKGFQLSIWHALWAPKGTPAEVIGFLNNVVQQAVNDPAFKNQMSQLGVEIYSKKEATPTMLKKTVQANLTAWATVFAK